MRAHDRWKTESPDDESIPCPVCGNLTFPTGERPLLCKCGEVLIDEEYDSSWCDREC